ncbi:nicotinate-nucleotide adenylyltransferase [Pleomorphomonas sp. JP5]|uniref:nicotinate-nucleotide adenylyltransferase n=1 Tax=Pleomorphomonas sp. JP5 TaxID=2942998 RepID=UPI002043B05F|nr:nicotinate-nucleotide adenylyltransferase [Pleomorphomonas sp. JP5]MCM5559792.1 nicotinate-nucleotide adenylyltransferase [Pleomorphomonas sp. JP5]
MTTPRLPATLPGMRVGLYGGSFNPPHRGHAHVARLALQRLQLDRIWWLVTPGNPLKSVDGLPNVNQRLAAVREVAHHPRAIVTDLESRLGTRYTIDLVRRLKTLRPSVRFVLVIGADNWATFHRWGGWREIARTVPIAVVDRPGATFAALASPAARTFAGARVAERDGALLPFLAPPAWMFIAGVKVPLSSSDLRRSTGLA